MKKNHEEKYSAHTNTSILLDRRTFLKSLGAFSGGIIVYFYCGVPSSMAQREGFRSRGQGEDFNAFLRIGEDGKVSCFTGKIEMGQGIITSLAQMAADELNVTYESIEMIMGDTDLCPWDMGTWGSMTTRFFGPMLRNAASEAKTILIELASESLNIPADQLAVKDGSVFHKYQIGKKVSYAELAKGKKIERRLKGEPSLEQPSEFTITGRSFPRSDAFEKVTGQAKYAGDIRLPGMLYARLLRPPAHGAELKSVDTSQISEFKDAFLVQEDDLLAVLHKNPDEAERALNKIKAEYTLNDSRLNDKNIFDHLLKNAPKSSNVSGEGDIDKGRKLARSLFEKTYFNSYVAHAPMETHTATVHIENGKVTVWASTQSPFGVRQQVARELGFPEENVRVKPVFIGGGFGGKSAGKQCIEAARLAKITGKPVQVAWSREEEFFYDTFRPAAIVKISSGLNKAGKIVFWDYHVLFAGSDGAEQYYDIPNHRELSSGGLSRSSGYHPFNVGPWRAPGNNTNTFARESHIDIMGSSTGMDPLEFRRNHLKDNKMRRVLKTGADAFGWNHSRGGDGRGLGVACGIRSGTYVATFAEVEVEKSSGLVRVIRITHAQDMGLVINPEGAKLQVEGSIIMGLGYALSEEIHFDNGRIFDLNFDTYEIPRFSWVPEIETILVKDDASPAQGGGEPAIVCMGAVIANAIFDATGARVLQLPMTPERIKNAMLS